MKCFKQMSALLVSAAVIASCGSGGVDNDYTRYVNPFIGTDFTGNTYPGATVPFGMVQLSPDNGTPGWHRISGYYYPDSTIAGFSHTHLTGTGAGDLYDIMYMPVTNPYREAKDSILGIYSMFDHADEEAVAGYYRVKLADYGITVELTATERCGIQRYTFPEASSSVFLNLKKAMNWDATVDSHIEVVDSVTLRGYRYSTGWAADQRVYFYAKLSRPFDDLEIQSVPVSVGEGQTGAGCVARLDYETAEGEQLVIRTALSGTSMEGAQRNFEAEATGEDFDAYVAAARGKWNTELGKIVVDSDDEDLKTCFYTALYHTMTAPTISSDVDGTYRGVDKQLHKAEHVTYGTFSLWDTYRAEHPLLTILHPERVNDMVKSFLDHYDQFGRLPVWNFYSNETDMMIGYHSVPVIVDAYMKGIGDFDAQKALDACIATANKDDYRGIGFYKEHGYVPAYTEPDKWENWSLSKTLEYAYDDWCIALMADSLGREDVAAEFYARSQNYRNVYNPATTFMQPRNERGEFVTPFNPDDYTEDICESNAWHYFWSVQHDIDGLIDLVGGTERFEQKLDSMFTYAPHSDSELPIFSTGMIGQYAHGNEPSHHVAYLYNYVGKPWKAQEILAEIMHELYRNAPHGLCGNEDCGQMSAWFVLSAMGFYPVNPVGMTYDLGTPLFPRVEVSLPDGKTFTVVAKGLTKDNVYVRSVTYNGQPLDRLTITHDMIMSGGELVFEMAAEPAV